MDDRTKTKSHVIGNTKENKHSCLIDTVRYVEVRNEKIEQK